MINTNDAAKALRIIADDLEKHGHERVVKQSTGVGIGYLIIDVTLSDTSYRCDLQFNPEMLKRNLNCN